MDLATLLLFTQQVGGSDLHLSAGAPIMVRERGEMRKLAGPDGRELEPRNADELRDMVYALLTEDQRKTLEIEKELDLAMSLGSGKARFRANVFFQDRGIGAVFRVIPTRIPSCEELGLPQVVRSFATLRNGLVLATGPSGTGKSTTLAALVDLVNSTRRGHVITIEEPIEFLHEPKLCMVNQRAVGLHTRSFANALRSALRENPDVIMVGELRDLETIALAITAAETGHLVLATLHTPNAAKTVDRVINVFPSNEQAQIRAMLADALQAVVAQVLLPRADGRGLVAAQEILVATSAVRAMVRDGKTHEIPTAIQTGAANGMQSFEQCLERLAQERLVERSVAEKFLVTLEASRSENGRTHTPPSRAYRVRSS